MAEPSGNKDYGDYFRALEESMQKDAPAPAPVFEDPAVQKAAPVSRKKRKFPDLPKKKIGACLLTVAVFLTSFFITRLADKKDPATAKKGKSVSAETAVSGPKAVPIIRATEDENTVTPGDDIRSKSVLFIDLDTHKIIARRDPDSKVYPASTTKIMTALVAAEQIADYSETFTVTLDITDPLYLAGATVAGFKAGEAVTMLDLLYGTILPSGGDAAMGLAIKTAGSEADFVKLMNRKATELGLKSTHFTNVTGLHDPNHYTTASDLAVILEAAMQQPICRKILSTFQYTTEPTPEHPDGLLMTSTLFSYMYGTEPEGATIVGGKTGFVNESGFCIAAFGESDGGKNYLCITMGAQSRWPGVFDQIHLFTAYAK